MLPSCCFIRGPFLIWDSHASWGLRATSYFLPAFLGPSAELCWSLILLHCEEVAGAATWRLRCQVVNLEPTVLLAWHRAEAVPSPAVPQVTPAPPTNMLAPVCSLVCVMAWTGQAGSPHPVGGKGLSAEAGRT